MGKDKGDKKDKKKKSSKAEASTQPNKAKNAGPARESPFRLLDLRIDTSTPDTIHHGLRSVARELWPQYRDLPDSAFVFKQFTVTTMCRVLSLLGMMLTAVCVIVVCRTGSRTYSSESRLMRATR